MEVAYNYKKVRGRNDENITVSEKLYVHEKTGETDHGPTGLFC